MALQYLSGIARCAAGSPRRSAFLPPACAALSLSLHDLYRPQPLERICRRRGDCGVSHRAGGEERGRNPTGSAGRPAATSFTTLAAGSRQQQFSWGLSLEHSQGDGAMSAQSRSTTWLMCLAATLVLLFSSPAHAA